MAIYKTLEGCGIDWRDEFGRRHRRYVGSEEAARAIEEKILEGVTESRLRLQTITGPDLRLSQGFEAFLSHTPLAPSTRKKYLLVAKSLTTTIADLPATQLTPTLIRAWLDTRQPTVAPTTLELEFQILRSTCRFLLAQGYTFSDPTKGIKVARGEPKPVIPITYEEEGIILEAWTRQAHRAKFLLALDAGLREGEITRLQRSQIDFAARTLTVISSKPRTIRTRLVPMTRRLEETLHPIADPLAPDAYITAHQARREKRASDFIRRVAKETPVAFHLHKLRHTFATRVSAVEPNPFVVAALLGHKPHSIIWKGAAFRLITPLYVHPTQEQLRGTIDRMEAANPNCHQNQKPETKDGI